MYRSIFVPLDGSDFGEHALPLAMSIARRAKADLHLASVHITLAPAYAETVFTYENAPDNILKQRERGYLDRTAGRVSEFFTGRVGAQLLEGSIAESLQQEAQTMKADLTVMTTHGRGPLARIWLGSVTDAMIRQCCGPVLLVRPDEGKVDLSRRPEFRHMLIALDGSPFAEQMLEPAVMLGSLMGADFTLLRVINPMVLGPYDPTAEVDAAALAQLEQMHQEDRLEAQRYLDALAGRLLKRSLRLQTRVAIHAQPALAILDEVRAHRADCVALATHGRSGLQRLILGSVADKVVRGSMVPVLVYRPREQN